MQPRGHVDLRVQRLDRYGSAALQLANMKVNYIKIRVLDPDPFHIRADSFSLEPIRSPCFFRS